MNRCQGCGIILQNNDVNKLGYIPKEKINETLCERCFRLIHYNDLKIVELPAIDILEKINKNGKYVFFLTDLLNINNEVINTFKSIKIPKTLIISKIDYLPKYIKKDKIKRWLQEEYEIKEEITFLSALKNFNIQTLKNTLNANNLKSAFLVGYTNVGKSTLVNKLKENNLITMSVVPNTTLDFIKINIDDEYNLIDSPGLNYQKTIYEESNHNIIKKLNPKSVLKPITYQLKNNASLVIEDIIRIENKSPKCNLTIYMSNLLNIVKVYENNKLLKELNNKELIMEKDEDIVIKGLGFINVKSDSKLKIYLKNQDLIEIRQSFFER